MLYSGFFLKKRSQCIVLILYVYFLVGEVIGTFTYITCLSLSRMHLQRPLTTDRRSYL